MQHRRVAQLAAQRHHGHPDGVGERVGVLVPGLLQQLLGADHPAAGAQQHVIEWRDRLRAGERKARVREVGHRGAGAGAGYLNLNLSHSHSSLRPTSLLNHPQAPARGSFFPASGRASCSRPSTPSTPTPTAGANTVGAASQDDNKITKTTLTVIIAVAASIGAIALAWTLFRKWQLRPSSNFDDRMQPIDWQPTGPEESGLPGVRRGNSTASHGSFQSSGHGHGGLEPLPEHDFTAGPTSFAPVGGYADLQRGPSPQPMAQLQRGPSATRADYAAYDYNTGVRY